MDGNPMDAFTALANHAFTIQLWITAVGSLIAGGAGAYFGAYLTKKAERRAAKEEFRAVLEEEVETTFETERVKTAIADAATRSLERLRTELQQRIAFATFRRERWVKMKDMMFEAALALDALRLNCQSVPWLREASISAIHEQGSVAISRVGYALAELREMQAVASEDVRASALDYKFRSFVSSVATYKDMIVKGHIELSGQADEQAKPAERSVLEEENEWGEQLEGLRTLVASLSIVPEPPFES